MIEVNVFTIGDSKDISTFSGIPDFFSKEFLDKRAELIISLFPLSAQYIKKKGPLS